MALNICGLGMVERRVRCPSCKAVVVCSGNPGEIVHITCPTCGSLGKVTFPTDIPSVPLPVDSSLVVQTMHLTKMFGKFTAVKDLQLTIKAGEMYGLLGPNGSGKTTTIKMLCGLTRPTSGTAVVLGEQVPLKNKMHLIGYMPQDTALYIDNTVHENLRLFGEIYSLSKEKLKQREQEVLQFIELGKWRNSLVSTLSGGMRHRVSLACALLHEPQVLFLDEPTVGVDPELRATFWDYFTQLTQQGVTIIISTHYLDEAGHCSRAGFLRHGRLIAEGTPDELKQKMNAASLEDAFLALTKKVDS